MDILSTQWHLAFANLIQTRAPPGFNIQTEVALTIEPQCADMLLLRRVGTAKEDDRAGVMRTLWPRLGLVTILELKSPSRSSFRPGDLLRLWSYGAVYDSSHLKELPSPSDLTLVLVLPSITPTLTREIERMGWTYAPLGGGYGRIDGAVYALYVVETDEVSQAEEEGFLSVWLKEQTNEGFDSDFAEMFSRLPFELRREFFTTAELLEGLSPEERLADLDRDQVALALTVELLRALSDTYIHSLSPETQEKIRQRLAEADH